MGLIRPITGLIAPRGLFEVERGHALAPRLFWLAGHRGALIDELSMRRHVLKGSANAALAPGLGGLVARAASGFFETLQPPSSNAALGINDKISIVWIGQRNGTAGGIVPFGRPHASAPGSPYADFTFYCSSTYMECRFTNTGGSTTTAGGFFPIYPAPEIWVATWDGTNIALYQNGVLVATGSLSGPVADSTGKWISLGDSGTTIPWDFIAASIYTRALTACEVLALSRSPYQFLRSIFRPPMRSGVTLTYARPDADVTDAGWTRDTGGNTDLYAAIDENPASDSDYIRSATLVSGDSADTCEVALGDLSDPGVDTQHTVSVRVRKADLDGVLRMDFDVSLYQGGTLIATRGWDDLSTSFATLDSLLLTTEADDITDYTDLRLRFSASTPAGNNPAIAYIGTANAASSSSVATFSGQSIGTAAADRQVVVVVTGQFNGTITGVTLDGVAMNQRVQRQDTGSNPDMVGGVWALPKASGTTATIAVSLSAGNDTIAISVYRLTGAAETPHDSDSNAGSAATIAFSGLTIPTNGVAVCGFANNTATTAVTWTNASEQNDVNVSGGSAHRHSSATIASAGTPTVTADGATANQVVFGVAWGKASARVDLSWAALSAPDAGGIGQAVSAAAAAAVALGKTVNKSIAVAAATSVGALRGAGKGVALACAGAAAFLRQAGKAVAATATGSVALAAARAYLQAVAAAVSTAVAVTRAVAIARAVPATSAVAQLRSAGKAIAAAAAAGVVLSTARQVVRAVAASCAAGVSVLRAAAKSLAVAAGTAVTASAIRVFLQAVAASASTATAWQRQAGKGLSVPAALGVALGRAAAKGVSLAASAGVALARVAAKGIALGAAAQAAVAASRAYLRAIAAGCTTASGLARQAAKGVAVSALGSVAVARARTVLRAVAVTAAAAVALPRAVALSLAAPAATGVQVARQAMIALQAALAGAVALVRQAGKRLAASAAVQAVVDATLGTGELFLVALGAAVGTGVQLGRQAGKRVAAAVGLLAWLFPPYRRPLPDPRRSEFALAMADLLGDRSLAVPASYAPLAGPAVTLRLVLRLGDEVRRASATGQVLPVLDATVDASAVAATNAGAGPREGDTVTIAAPSHGAGQYRVRSAARGMLRTSWRLRLERLS